MRRWHGVHGIETRRIKWGIALLTHYRAIAEGGQEEDDGVKVLDRLLFLALRGDTQHTTHNKHQAAGDRQQQ